MGLRLSGSRVGLALGCLYPFRPDVVIPRQPSSEAARIGTAFHAAAEAHLRGEPIPQAATLADSYELSEADAARVYDRAVAWSVSWDDLMPSDLEYEPEVPFCYDPIGGRAMRLPGTGRAAYAGLPGDQHITCTADVVAVAGDRVLIVDHKTGRPQAGAAEHPQMQAMAAIIGEAVGASTAMVELHYVRDDGSIYVDSARLDALDRAAILSDLRELFAAYQQRDAPPTPGAHCTDGYCPLVASCPAVRRELAPLPVAQLSAQIDSPAALLAWLEAKPKAEAMLKQIGAAAKAYADASGGCVELPDGRRYREVTSRRKSLDAARVRADHGDRYDRETTIVSYRTTGRKQAKDTDND